MYLSHNEPPKLLTDHLIETSNYCKQFLPHKYRTEMFQKVAECIGLLHDIGKYNQKFQDYLHKIRVNPAIKNHGPLSALVAYKVVKETAPWPYPLIAFLCVRHHHGNLRSPRYIFDESNIETELRVISRIQLKYISAEAISEIKQISDLAAEILQNPLDDIIEEIRVDVQRLWREWGVEYYFGCVTLYSCLINADKHSAMQVKPRQEDTSLPGSEVIDLYIKKLQQNPKPVDKLRQEIYECIKYAVKGHYIYSLTLPTGAGKTLNGLKVALHMKKDFKLNRIIYALPWTSVLDQNYGVFKKVFGGDTKIGLHHHLSEIPEQLEEMSARELEKFVFGVEGWEKSITCTTFHQLFHSLIGYKNGYLRKLHNLANSVVIIDEIQALPPLYYPVLEEAIKYFAQKYNTYFVIMTATKPYILPKHCMELAGGDYFSRPEFNRTELVLYKKLEGKETIGEFVARFKDSYSNDQSYMIIVNTIGCAKEIYKLLKEHGISSLHCLTTHMIPKDRKGQIKTINKEIDHNKKPVVVATQLVEAGVDLDFDYIYRDFAPLDCIIQAAGRCNRNGKKPVGRVEIINLCAANGREYADYIYRIDKSNILLELTRKTFYEFTEHKAQAVVDSFKMNKMCSHYFSIVRQNMEGVTSRELLSSMAKLEFDDPGSTSISSFQLIADIPKCDVFIEKDDKAKYFWEKWKEIKEIKDFITQRAEYRKIKPKFKQYVISLTENHFNSFQEVLTTEVIGSFYYLPFANVEIIYNENIGLDEDNVSLVPTAEIW